jgi:osmotically-inducible protein OsmY
MDAEVRNGKVVLSGTLTDPRQREAIHVVIEREAPGLTIVDHMVWIEPYSGSVMEVPE